MILLMNIQGINHLIRTWSKRIIEAVLEISRFNLFLAKAKVLPSFIFRSTWKVVMNADGLGPINAILRIVSEQASKWCQQIVQILYSPMLQISIVRIYPWMETKFVQSTNYILAFLFSRNHWQSIWFAGPWSNRFVGL